MSKEFKSTLSKAATLYNEISALESDRKLCKRSWVKACEALAAEDADWLEAKLAAIAEFGALAAFVRNASRVMSSGNFSRPPTSSYAETSRMLRAYGNAETAPLLHIAGVSLQQICAIAAYAVTQIPTAEFGNIESVESHKELVATKRAQLHELYATLRLTWSSNDVEAWHADMVFRTAAFAQHHSKIEKLKADIVRFGEAQYEIPRLRTEFHADPEMHNFVNRMTDAERSSHVQRLKQQVAHLQEEKPIGPGDRDWPKHLVEAIAAELLAPAPKTEPLKRAKLRPDTRIVPAKRRHGANHHMPKRPAARAIA